MLLHCNRFACVANFACYIFVLYVDCKVSKMTAAGNDDVMVMVLLVIAIVHSSFYLHNIIYYLFDLYSNQLVARMKCCLKFGSNAVFEWIMWHPDESCNTNITYSSLFAYGLYVYINYIRLLNHAFRSEKAVNENKQQHKKYANYSIKRMHT